eukprot:3542064-Rhodomonas_salina.2
MWFLVFDFGVWCRLLHRHASMHASDAAEKGKRMGMTGNASGAGRGGGWKRGEKGSRMRERTKKRERGIEERERVHQLAPSWFFRRHLFGSSNSGLGLKG